MKEYIVYMLRCADGSYYIGITNDLERRLSEHQYGRNPRAYTHRRRPVRVVYSAIFSEIIDAIAWEKHLKKWSRKKKEALINEEYEKLPELSKRRTPFCKTRRVSP